MDADGVHRFIDDSDTVDTEADGSWFPGFPWDNTGTSTCGCLGSFISPSQSIAYCYCVPNPPLYGICEVLETAGPEVICDGMFACFMICI